MIISIAHRFIFLANIRNASLAIEVALRPLGDVIMSETAFGKHDGLARIQEKYSFIFDQLPVDRFLIFGIMRNPVDFVLSVYNNHARDAFDDQPQSTKGMTFEEFWTEWRQTHRWMLVPQHERFLDNEGKMAVNFIVHFDKLEMQLAQMFREAYGIELPLEIQHLNVSPKVLTADQLSPDQIEDVERVYAEDIRLLNDGTGRWLGSFPEIAPEIQFQLRRDVDQRLVMTRQIAELQKSRLSLSAMQQRIRRLEGEVLAWRRKTPAVSGELEALSLHEE
jgi:hypothetical protein